MIIELLEALKAAGIEVTAQGGNLAIRPASKTIPYTPASSADGFFTYNSSVRMSTDPSGSV
jgi:hypothetical protein